MKELVVISGKGGTGKTSLVAAFAALGAPLVVADCDVDAADLHLVLAPQIRERAPFRSGHEARIRPEACTRCGVCRDDCRFGAIMEYDHGDARAGEVGSAPLPALRIDPWACEGCGVCVEFCPEGAIDFPERTSGEWYVSDTRYGPLVHARLEPAQENSGKLVTLVRKEAGKLADQRGRRLVLIDGSPGVGCPVIASVTGASFVLIVTEPTRSARHDLERVMDLTRHFHLPAGVCINKSDINPQISAEIADYCRAEGRPLLGEIAYDPAVTRAQLAGRSVIEDRPSAAAEQMRGVWGKVCEMLDI
ncbi:MAG: 4Fe-4S dicluster domain-containing protein [Candidatus Eisenbacteria bacterium]|nr:4Fe-4S dicluster domain-containing protein [Candidatus Eisenbacteria bacterium]